MLHCTLVLTTYMVQRTNLPVNGHGEAGVNSTVNDLETDCFPIGSMIVNGSDGAAQNNCLVQSPCEVFTLM